MLPSFAESWPHWIIVLNDTIKNDGTVHAAVLTNASKHIFMNPMCNQDPLSLTSKPPHALQLSWNVRVMK